MEFIETARSIVTVGGGRGFVIDGAFDRLIVTAAHCLPFLPPAMTFSDPWEKTYKSLISVDRCRTIHISGMSIR
jgi:hypothetical protein